MNSPAPSGHMVMVIPALLLLVGAGVAARGFPLAATGEPQVRLALAVAVVALLLTPIALSVIVPGCDLVLAAATGMLQVIGVVTLLVVARDAGPDTGFFSSLAVRQELYVVGGSLALLTGAAGARHVDRLITYPYTLLAAALVLTLVTMLAGRSVNGARLWLAAGPVSFQPSELSRLLLVGFVAVYLYDKRYLVTAPWRVLGINLPPAPYLLPLVIATAASIAVLVLQNDLGMAALVALGALATVTAAVRLRPLTFAGLILLGLAGALSLAAVPRVGDRVAAWLDPWHDPAGVGFQFVQSEYGLAGGQVIGQEQNTPAIRIPELHTDFMLAAIGGELGWLVAVATVMLAAVLVCRCVLASLRAKTMFRSLLVLAFACLIAIQILLIVGGTLRVLPLTGLTLPLVSYGGTSMLATCLAIGVAIGIGAPGRSLAAGGRAMPVSPVLSPVRLRRFGQEVIP